MFLSRFRVRGYKCLEDLDLALTPIHVLIGPSDSGKSCLLEAISALCGRLKTPATQWFPAAANPRELVTLGSSVPTIDLAGQWSEIDPQGGPPQLAAGFGYSILVPTNGTNFAITDQWVRPRAGNDPQSGLTRMAIAYPHGGGRATEEDHAAQKTFRETVQPMLHPAPVYRLDPRRLAEPARFDASPGGPMAADGHGLPWLLDEIAQRHPQRFAEIQAEFCRIAPQYAGLSLQAEPLPAKGKPSASRQPASLPPTARGLVFETRSGRRLAARQVSGGSLLLLAMLTLARPPEPPPMLLIEDPEQGLYPPWLDEVIKPLKQAAYRPGGQPFPQVILSTRSPAVLNFFSAEEVTLLARPADKPDGPVLARPLAGMESIKQKMSKGKVRLGELWGKFE